MAQEPSRNPSTRSRDAEAMMPFLELAQALQGGAAGMRAAGEKYLPRFSGEDMFVYEVRREHARLTNVFMDIVESLSLKPFSERVTLGESTPQEIVDFARNVDGFGTSLHMHLLSSFGMAMRDGIAWVMVDWPDTGEVPEAISKAESNRLGLKPIWSKIKTINVLDVRSETFGQMEYITHFRIMEAVQSNDGFETEAVEQVKVYRQPTPADDPTWETWRKDSQTDDWVIFSEPQAMTISRIPVVPVILGRRDGMSWYVHPPLKAAADLQVELYQEENNLKNVRTLTAFPMLSANGVVPPDGGDGAAASVVVGPSTVLYGGSDGSYSYVEPNGQSLNFLKESLKETIRELRELGRQPLTAMSGQQTVVNTAAIASKSSSALQAWVQTASQAAAKMLDLTAEWMDVDLPDAVEVNLFDDFDLSSDDPNFAHILEMGRDGLISRERVIEEAMRRGILGAGYDMEADLEKIEADVIRSMPEIEANEEFDEDKNRGMRNAIENDN